MMRIVFIFAFAAVATAAVVKPQAKKVESKPVAASPKPTVSKASPAKVETKLAAASSKPSAAKVEVKPVTAKAKLPAPKLETKPDMVVKAVAKPVAATPKPAAVVKAVATKPAVAAKPKVVSTKPAAAVAKPAVAAAKPAAKVATQSAAVKADLLQEVAEHNSKAAGFDATLKEQKNKQETISLELDQVKSLKDTLEKLREEKRMADHRIDELKSAVKGAEDGKLAQEEEFKLKMQRMVDLLTNMRKQREETQSSLSNARQDGESKSQESMSMRRKLEQDFLDAKTDGDSWDEKAEDDAFNAAKEQLKAQKTRAEELDSQRREVESKLRGDLATAEARLRRLESEVSRANTAVEDGKAAMAEKQSEMTSKISALERQVSEYTKISKNADLAREAAERKMGDQSSSHTSLGERLGMAAEELFTRQVEFALEKQRLSGALEESRRTLRNSLAVPTSTTAIDTVRITGLEQQLAEERRKSIEQAVALQRAERKVTQLDDANKRSEDARQQAVANGRDAERRCVTLSEDLRKAQVKQATADVRLDEVRERGSMASAEIQTVQYVAKYNEARLRGHLDELRYMIKKSESTRR